MTDDDFDDFDDLLDITQDDVPAPVKAEAAPVVVDAPKATPRRRGPNKPKTLDPVDEDPLDAEIRALEAKVQEPDFEEVGGDSPEVAAKRERIKDLQDKLAAKGANAAENAPPVFVQATGPGKRILIHFEVDGFTALGALWYRGQELEFTVGSPAYEQTKDTTGASWLDLADDRRAQIARWGQVMFSPGPFAGRPGETFDDEVAREDARRGRAVPVIRH